MTDCQCHQRAVGERERSLRLEAYDRALRRIAGLSMDWPCQMEREGFYHDQLQAAIGLAARTVQVWGGAARPPGSGSVGGWVP